MKKKEFRLPKVKFYTDGEKEVVATVKFNGKLLRAVAKCNPVDKFDEKVGKNVAYNRVLDKFFREKYRFLCDEADNYREIERIISEKVGRTVRGIDETLEGYSLYCGVSVSELVDRFSK